MIPIVFNLLVAVFFDETRELQGSPWAMTIILWAKIQKTVDIAPFNF
jgi:hypothetical protein